MSKLLNKGWVLLAAMLVFPFVLLAATHIVGRLEGDVDFSFFLLLLCIVSIYASLVAGVVMLACGMLFWFLTVVDFKRGELLLLVLFACADIVAFFLWMKLFVRHIHFRY
jgi:hypothetical protein